jgi:ATP-dependent Clp protease adaptor protein ClpS
MKSATASPDVKEYETHQIELIEEPLLGKTYHLVLWNDDVSSYQWVIHILMTVLGYTKAKALEKTKSVEASGKGIVYSGSLELCELRHEQFTEAKLTTTIEPG